MPKPIPLSLVVVLILLVWATDVFADHFVYVPLQTYSDAVSPQTASRQVGMIQQVGGVTSRGGAAIGARASAMPMPPPRRYPQMHAPMYPTPVPNVPVQVGGTVITNQAFAPQEMLYPHEYKSLYPPFYHKVSGAWWWTPFGMESHDRWELQGTEVKVKYRSSFAPFSNFSPRHNW
ncbi:MAG TPA: hypothetical protein VK137_07365 [Planctomycetaceae bacterium]|nr:hypothetical protein [Planctomycetaceae bacterium]